MEDNEDSFMGGNELNSQLTGLNKGNLSKKVKIFITLTIFSIILISILIIIILVKNTKDSNKSTDSDDGNNNLEKLAEINCIYDILDINKNTILLGNDFIKTSNFDIFINNEKIKYTKEYKFSSFGINKVKYVLYEEIMMDYMFKEVNDLLSVEMISEKNCKIKSMISLFENSINLKEIKIKGFNTKEVKSLQKLFYNTSISEIDISDINTENVLNMSYMFSYTNIEKINIFKFNTNNVVDMSYMFQHCNSLKDIDISKLNT